MTVVQVLPCENEWAYKDIEYDWITHSTTWRIVTEEFHDYCLNVLPPMDWNNGKFLVSEPYTHIELPDGSVDGVYCCVATIGDRHFARYVPRRVAKRMVEQLRELIAKGEPCLA